MQILRDSDGYECVWGDVCVNGWSTRAIQTLVNAAPKTKQALSDTDVWNLNLDQIESHGGRVLEKVYVSTEKLGPSTFAFESRTVLYSKLRPYLNKVVVADEAGFATTELVPLRCNPDELHPEYLAYFLRSEDFLKFATEVVAGAKMPRMVMSEFWNFQVPLPPLPEQRRIAAILDQADALRAKRREALAQLDSLTQSIFIEMFGDPVENSKGWPTAYLSAHVSKLGSGSTPTGGDAAYKESGISLIRSLNVHDGEFKYKNLAFIDAAQAGKLSNVVVAEGDVLLNITGASVARVCSVPSDVLPARVNQHVMIIRPKPTLNRLFLERLLLNPQMKTRLLQIGGAGATREAITKAQAEELVIPIPPIQIQNEYAARISVLLAIKNDHRSALAELNTLFASLQHRAFRGEL